MSINWNKRVKSTTLPVKASFVTGTGTGLLGKVVFALLRHTAFTEVHAPLVTKVAVWFMAVSDTPISEIEAIDEVHAVDDGLSVCFSFWGEGKTLTLGFDMDDELCCIKRLVNDAPVVRKDLVLTEPEAGVQFLREYHWLES